MIGERPPVTANLILPILIKPVLNKLEAQSHEAALEIKIALLRAESAFPGLILELITKLTKHKDPNLNMIKTLLSLQGSVSDSEEYKENSFVELNRRAGSLKKILSRIPNEISDRKMFLETIKEVASAIKKMLDCLTDIINTTEDAIRRQALEDRKRDFIKCSKRFSNKLKDYFKNGQVQTVFLSAAHLINQIYAIQLTVKL